MKSKVILNNIVIISLFIFQQEILKEKDSQIEENKRLLSERQETISQLEQTLSNSRLELTEGEKRINDSLQLEVYYRPCFVISSGKNPQFYSIIVPFKCHLSCLTISHGQASLKSEVEKQKKIVAQLKVIEIKYCNPNLVFYYYCLIIICTLPY